MNKHLSFFICCMILCVQTYSQRVSVPSTIKTPYGNVKTTSQVYMPMHGNTNYKGRSGPASYKFNYTAVLLNNDSIQFRAKIQIEDSLHYITYKNKNATSTNYYPKDTKELYTITREGVKINGIPTDSCWLFKTTNGKINFYSFLPHLETDLVVAVQAGDGLIISATKENVLQLVESNKKAAELAEKDKLVRALRKFNEYE